MANEGHYDPKMEKVFVFVCESPFMAPLRSVIAHFDRIFQGFSFI